MNLNGPWSFDFDPQDAGLKEEWFTPGKHELKRKITVPFPWESRLSGIGDTQYKAGFTSDKPVAIGGERLKIPAYGAGSGS